MKTLYELRAVTKDGHIVDEGEDVGRLEFVADELSKYNPYIDYFIVRVERHILSRRKRQKAA